MGVWMVTLSLNILSLLWHVVRERRALTVSLFSLIVDPLLRFYDLRNLGDNPHQNWEAGKR